MIPEDILYDHMLDIEPEPIKLDSPIETGGPIEIDRGPIDYEDIVNGTYVHESIDYEDVLEGHKIFS